MKVIFDITKSGCIAYGVQYCETVEGFQAIKESHPDDTFEVANMFSQLLLEEFTEFLAFMGWSANDWWISNGYNKEDFIPIQDEKDEAEYYWFIDEI